MALYKGSHGAVEGGREGRQEGGREGGKAGEAQPFRRMGSPAHLSALPEPQPGAVLAADNVLPCSQAQRGAWHGARPHMASHEVAGDRPPALWGSCAPAHRPLGNGQDGSKKAGRPRLSGEVLCPGGQGRGSWAGASLPLLPHSGLMMDTGRKHNGVGETGLLTILRGGDRHPAAGTQTPAAPPHSSQAASPAAPLLPSRPLLQAGGPRYRGIPPSPGPSP